MEDQIKQLNELSFERLSTVNQYVVNQKKLQEKLDSARFLISKARTLNGVILTNVAQPELIDLESDFKFDVQEGQFEIQEVKEEPEEDDESKTETVRKTPQFRPFGVLEPQSAKEARSIMKSTIPLISSLATLRMRIQEIDDKMQGIKENLQKAEADFLSNLVKCLSI